MNQFLKKNRTRFTTLFGIVLLCLLSIVFRIVPITATRQANRQLLETLFGCASSPCPREEAYVVRTAATLRMTAFEKFCHCVQTKYSERGASMVSRVVVGIADFRLLTSAMPSGAARAGRPFSGADVETENLVPHL